MKCINLFRKLPRWLSWDFCSFFSFIFVVLLLSLPLSAAVWTIYPLWFSASPQPKFTNSQILSIFPQRPVVGSPCSPPHYPPTATPWGQQGLLGNQWPGPAAAPWPTMPSGVWAPNPGLQPEVGRVTNGGITPPTPSLYVSGNPTQVHPPNTVHDLLQ